MSTNKMALNFTIRDAAATRGYASDTDFEVYSKALLQLATEREARADASIPEHEGIQDVAVYSVSTSTISRPVWRAGAKTREAENGGGGRENYANMAW
ncbi:hypothetical protein E4U27_005426 [Claviceps purpurea]|nr:hypothetical protein E4U27_005426 [Claviceps purpurea]